MRHVVKVGVESVPGVTVRTLIPYRGVGWSQVMMIESRAGSERSTLEMKLLHFCREEKDGGARGVMFCDREERNTG